MWPKKVVLLSLLCCLKLVVPFRHRAVYWFEAGRLDGLDGLDDFDGLDHATTSG